MPTTLAIMLLLGQVPPVAADPVPLTSPSTWISLADYPEELHGLDGRTVATLLVDPRGQVVACDIRVPSGSGILDETVCRRAREQGRFTPARGADGVAIDGSYVFPVVWGRPTIVVAPSRRSLVATMANGKAVSCTTHDFDEAIGGVAGRGCNISVDLLLRYFGPGYVRADRLTIETATIAGDGPVPRGTVAGRRVTLKEAVVTIGPDGRVKTCRSRLPPGGPTGTMDNCVGYPTDRRFTGLATFVRVIDWTLRFPVPNAPAK